MPFANAGWGIAVVDNIIYLIGGMLTPSSPPIATVMAYDPVTESWTQKADMPTARGALSACVVEGKVYAIGGCTENWRSFSYKHVEVYDPSNDTWTRKSDMPTERWGLGTCVVDGEIYAIGGWSGSDACTANEVYDPMTDTWTIKSPMQQRRNGAFVCALEDTVYVIGGAYAVPSPGFLRTAEEYDTGLGVPSPDFNGDGRVDINDLLRLIESWGQEDQTVDVGPLPFGDGLIDTVDLEVLMSCWEQDVQDDTLVAHWKLDETEGLIAYDSAGNRDGTIMGMPAWHPTGGVVDGALELDGTTFAIADFVLNPKANSFSVLAWVKDGSPGHVLISQQTGANWLMLDPVAGTLMTELCSGGRESTWLYSDTVISDGVWHRVGFAWDGSNRRLYVDGTLVAESPDSVLLDCDGGVNIGCGKLMEPSSLFTGLIDDVRIYNRAVKP
jgi:hypothetical protein